MPTIELQTKPVVPNAVYTPQILLQTGIINGKLVTSCQIAYSGASVDTEGNWEMAGMGNTVYIPDVLNLEEDLKDLGPEVQQMYGIIVDLVGRINTIRKVL